MTARPRAIIDNIASTLLVTLPLWAVWAVLAALYTDQTEILIATALVALWWTVDAIGLLVRDLRGEADDE